MIIVKPNKDGIKKAIAILKKGGTVVYPTDTAYALGGIFNSRKVQAKILKIKKRKDEKFTLIAASLAQVNKFFKLNSSQKKIVNKLWPASLSLVVSSRFAVRVPKNKIATSLARGSGKPLIATSANLAGTKTLYDSKKIIDQFENKKNPRLVSKREPDLIIDYGRLKKIETSTIVKVSKKGIKVLRKGAVKVTE